MNQNGTEVKSDRDFLASIVDSSKDSIVTIDLHGIVTSWNKAAEDLYGYPASEAIGKSLSMVVLPEDIRQLFADIDRITQNLRVERYETIRPNKDGTMMNLEIVLSPVRDPTGRVIGVSTVARNITERKKIEKALQISEARFKAIVNQAGVGIFQTDLDGILTLVNEKTCEMLRYESAEIIGKSIMSLQLHRIFICKSRSFGRR